MKKLKIEGTIHLKFIIQKECGQEQHGNKLKKKEYVKYRLYRQCFTAKEQHLEIDRWKNTNI